MLTERTWKAFFGDDREKAEARRGIAAETDRLLGQNRELTTEIKIRDGMISDLLNRVAVLEDQNAALRFCLRDWGQGPKSKA